MHREGNAKMYEALHDYVWSKLQTSHVLYQEAYGRFQRLMSYMRCAAIRGESICGSTYKAMLQEQHLVDKYYEKLALHKKDFDQLSSIAAMVASNPEKEFIMVTHPDGTWSFGPKDVEGEE